MCDLLKSVHKASLVVVRQKQAGTPPPLLGGTGDSLIRRLYS